MSFLPSFRSFFASLSNTFSLIQAQHLVLHLAEKVEDLPSLERELRDLKVRAEMWEEQHQAAKEVNNSLLAECERWAEQSRLYEQSLTELARLSDRVVELEGQVATPSKDEVRRREVVEARNQRLNSEIAALKQKVMEVEEARKRAAEGQGLGGRHGPAGGGDSPGGR